MTLPYERFNAVCNTRRFLVSLLTPSLTPRVPSGIRKEARRLLKHYPWDLEAEILAHTDISDIARMRQKKSLSGRKNTTKERKP